MAGNYADAPSWRMAYDRDGTQVFTLAGGVATPIAAATIQAMNKEDGVGWDASPGGWSTTSFLWIFPEHRDIDAITLFHVGNAAINVLSVQTSTDTTNGVDGTWTTQTVPTVQNAWKPNYRTGIQQRTWLGVKALKINIQMAENNYYGDRMRIGCHLYGEPVPGENTDRLEIWHPTLDQRVGPAYFDMGDTPRGSTGDLTFRVKNISTAKTALSCRVAMDALTDTTPTVLSQEALSLDGSSWTAQVNVGDLGPGVISQIVTLRRTLVDTAMLGTWSFRVFSESTSAWV